MKHCCVIGGTGFIGSNVVWLLNSTKRRITVLGRSRTPSRDLPAGVRYISGNYGDPSVLREALHSVDEVIHLAYSTVPKTSFEDPVQDILDNLPETVRLFETAANLEVSRIVLVSSGGTVYGKANKLPINENHPTNPISPYGITKLASEKYALMFNELKGLPVICVRPGNAYGEGQKPFTGQGFIATAIVSILRNQEVVIYGENGTVRDYIHVTDVAKGIIAALEHGKPGSFYNVGTCIGRHNKDILAAISPLAEASGLTVRIKALPSRRFDVPANVLDSTKLNLESGWKALVSFEKGIESTWEWLYNTYNNHANRSSVGDFITKDIL